MAEIFDSRNTLKLLDWTYEKALDGLPAMKSIQELGDEYLERYESVYQACDGLINWQCAKNATSGFITGLGGLLTLPITVPVNICSVIYVQIRMIGAIAYMNG